MGQNRNEDRTDQFVIYQPDSSLILDEQFVADSLDGSETNKTVFDPAIGIVNGLIAGICFWVLAFIVFHIF